MDPKVIACFKRAARELRVKIVAPYVLRHGQSQVLCTAFLPDFGSAAGMVVGTTAPPAFSVDSALVEAAKGCGMSYSFVNVELYSDYSPDSFKEMLSDWGFYGNPSQCPPWLSPNISSAESLG